MKEVLNLLVGSVYDQFTQSRSNIYQIFSNNIRVWTKVGLTEQGQWSSSEVSLPADHTGIDHRPGQEGSMATREVRGGESRRGHLDPIQQEGNRKEHQQQFSF